MIKYKLINNIAGWSVFVVAAIVYLLTIESTASFWDCGEFISSAYKLEVGHPPGAPIFMLVGNLFTQFAQDPSQVAKMVNSMSALMSALTILFLFWTITHLTRKLVISRSGEELTLGQTDRGDRQRTRRRIGLYFFRHLLVLGRGRGGICLFIDAHRPCLLADPQMGGQCREATFRQMDRAHRLYHGLVHRRAPAQPALHPGNCTGLLFQE